MFHFIYNYHTIPHDYLAFVIHLRSNTYCHLLFIYFLFFATCQWQNSLDSVRIFPDTLLRAQKSNLPIIFALLIQENICTLFHYFRTRIKSVQKLNISFQSYSLIMQIQLTPDFPGSIIKNMHHFLHVFCLYRRLEQPSSHLRRFNVLLDIRRIDFWVCNIGCLWCTLPYATPIKGMGCHAPESGPDAP